MECLRFAVPPGHFERIGLPRWFGQPIPPLDEYAQERFLATLVSDKQFAAAVRNLLGAA
jgi:hypothetical protein